MQELISAFGIDWRLIVIQTMNFAIVLAGLSYFLYGPVMRMITKREEVIAKGLEDAQTAAAERAHVAEEKGSIIQSAHQEAEAVVLRAEEEAKKERARIVHEAQARAEKALADASLQGEEMKRRALAESEKEIARAAVLAAENILRKS